MRAPARGRGECPPHKLLSFLSFLFSFLPPPLLLCFFPSFLQHKQIFHLMLWPFIPVIIT